MKWKPSKTAKRAFALKMQDPVEATAYQARKEARATKRRQTSKFDYESAGGSYIPTKAQFDYCIANISESMPIDTQTAFNEVMFGYSNCEKVHHDYIHIVNEHTRSNK